MLLILKLKITVTRINDFISEAFTFDLSIQTSHKYESKKLGKTQGSLTPPIFKFKKSKITPIPPSRPFFPPAESEKVKVNEFVFAYDSGIEKDSSSEEYPMTI